MSHLDARDDLREMAELYETIASLDLTPEPGGAHGVPGSRVPPGMQEILDADEVTGGLREVDGWAEFLVHVLVDEHLDMLIHGWPPARLRLIGEYAGHFLDHEDEMFALAFQDDLHDHLRRLRKLAKRGTRNVRTGMACREVTCDGRYSSTIGFSSTGDLRCDRCGNQVPYTEWSTWPRTGHYVTVQHAANMSQTTVNAVRVRASRGKWRRMGEGRDVRYHADDVRRDMSG